MNPTASVTSTSRPTSFASALVDRSTNVLVPIVALAAALIVGIGLIAAEGQPPFAVYEAVVRRVFVEENGEQQATTAGATAAASGEGVRARGEDNR